MEETVEERWAREEKERLQREAEAERLAAIAKKEAEAEQALKEKLGAMGYKRHKRKSDALLLQRSQQQRLEAAAAKAKREARMQVSFSTRKHVPSNIFSLPFLLSPAFS